MDQNQGLQAYLLVKKEAYRWLIWWGSLYLLGVIGVIILAYYNLPSYNRFFSTLQIIMLPLWFLGGYPHFIRKNKMERDNPQLKKEVSKGIAISWSIRLRRYVMIGLAALILIVVFFNTYKQGMEEVRKSDVYERLHQ